MPETYAAVAEKISTLLPIVKSRRNTENVPVKTTIRMIRTNKLSTKYSIRIAIVGSIDETAVLTMSPIHRIFLSSYSLIHLLGPF